MLEWDLLFGWGMAYTRDLGKYLTNTTQMVKTERNAIEFNWDANGSGKFEAVVINGELKHFMGISASGSIDIYSNDYKFILAMRDKINELEEQVKSQLMRMGKNGVAKPAVSTPA